MNKRFLIPLIAIICGLLLGCATTNTSQSPQIHPLNEGVQMLSESLLASTGQRQVGKITVADFIGPQEALTGLGEYIAEKVSVRLFSTGRFSDFMERRQLKQVVSAIKMENSGYFDQDTVSKFGKMIGIDSMVIGTVKDLGSHYDVTVKIVQSQTGAIIAMADVMIAKDETTISLIAMQRTATLTVVVDPPVSGKVVAGGQQVALRNGTASISNIPYGECAVIISPDGYEAVRKSIAIRSPTEVLSETLTPKQYAEFRGVGTANISYQCDPQKENPCPPTSELKRRAIEVAKIHALQELSQRLGVDVTTLSSAAAGRLSSETVTTRSGATLAGIQFPTPVINGDEVSIDIVAQAK